MSRKDKKILDYIHNKYNCEEVLKAIIKGYPNVYNLVNYHNSIKSIK